MDWNFDFDAAPRDGRQILVATTGDARKLFLTKWLEPNNYVPTGRWDGFPPSSKTLLAWQDVPDHPTNSEALL